MNAKQDALIEKQQNYLDFVLAEQPYRKVAPWDKSNARAELAALRTSVATLTAQNAEQARRIDEARNWHPIGFSRDPLASRGWGTLVEAVSGNPITFEELVSRYNALLFSATAPAPQESQT